MLKPRNLPAAHKNQLFIPVKCIGFFNDEQTRSFFRNHEIVKKRVKPKPAGVFAPSSHRTQEDKRDFSDKDPASSKNSVTSLIHVRGRASRLDLEDVTLNLDETPRKSSTPDKDNVLKTSFLTEDPLTSRSYDGRSSVFSPVLECSKYTVIGEPKFRKKRVKRTEWTLPKILPTRGFMEPQDAGDPKTNSIDLRSIYGARSKIQQVSPELSKEDTVILPPLEIGGRRQEVEASMDSGSLAEKRLVMHNRQQSIYRKMVKDQVVLPSAYKPYFRFRNRQHKFVRTLFTADDVWENNPQPVHCSRCVHQSTATVHYCDVLGKRFCRFCSEMTNRAFSNAYEGNRMLVPSPDKSPTLQMLKEPSFIGVRKIVITKTTKETTEEGQVEKRDLETHIDHSEREK